LSSKVDLQPAYVLHARPYRETSLLLELLSAEYGKIALVARGVRGKKSSTKNRLQPFNPLTVSWVSKGELGTLVGVEQNERGCVLHGNRLASGFYINELTIKLIARNDPHPGLFGMYQQTLQAIETKPNYEVSLRLFEKRLLDEIGYGLNLDHEMQTGEQLQSDKLYRYRVEEGAEEIDSHPKGPAEVSGATLIGLKNGVLDSTDTLREAKGLLRVVLQNYLGNSTIRSRELLVRKRSTK